MEKAPKGIDPHSRFPDGFRILKGRQEYVTYADHSSVRIWASAVASCFDTHMHSAIEIIVPDSGVSVYRLPKETYRVHGGEILIVPSGCSHSLTESEDISRHLILFEPAPLFSHRDVPGIGALLEEPIFLKADSALGGEVGALLKKVIECYSVHEKMWNLECYSYLLQVYALLGREYLSHRSPEDEGGRMSIDPPIMNSAITYINEHYMEDISLEQVADFTGFSKYYFSRVFKSFAGMSFSDFLTGRRLSAATDLLIRTGRSVRSVSAASGFSSISTFNRIFRRYKKCTPTQFRAIYSTVPGPGTDIDSMWSTHGEEAADEGGADAL